MRLPNRLRFSLGSLRSKLVVSYAAVIMLSLLLAGISFTYLVRSYQTQLRLNQLAELSLPLNAQMRLFEHVGVPPAQIHQYLQDQSAELNIRIFLLDQNRQIVFDSGGKLVGQTFPVLSDKQRQLRLTMEWGTAQLANQPPLMFVAVTPRNDPHRDHDPLATDNMVLAVPAQTVSTAWSQLAPRLALAAIASLIISSIVAIILARSIARPLAQVTKASERMACGDFDQFIPVNSQDEIGQLANSFNAMAREVGTMHRTMRDLLANVSHELRTPLTSIEGFAHAMADGTIKTPEEYVDAGHIIGEEADRMHRLVEDLLYLSKIESGQAPLRRQILDLTELLQTCVRQVQFQAESAGLNIELDTQPVPVVSADGHRLQQVFVNLLDNAVKHSPRGGIVAVRAYPESAVAAGLTENGVKSRSPGRWIAIDVHNSGGHIPPEHLGRIFERFYQVDRSRSRSSDGAGLGLSIVREIVQAHEGRITVASDPRKGTTFTVHLPAAA